MQHKCDKEKSIDIILHDVRELREDVKALLQFKWQVMGGTIVVSFLFSIFIPFVVELFK